MKKFVFNEETFNKYGDAEPAAMEYADRTIDEFLNDCFGEVKVAGYSYKTSIVLRQTDAILFRIILSDYYDDCIGQISEIEVNEENDLNISSSTANNQRLFI